MTNRVSRVVLMCGPAGSGKTTFSMQLETQGFNRLSIDEEVWRMRMSGALTPESDVPSISRSIEEDLKRRLVGLVRDGKDVVVDLSFWKRSVRDAYRTIVEENGGITELVYFRVSPDELHARVRARQGQANANSVNVDPTTLDQYIADFEVPGEDEHPTVIDSMPEGTA